MPSTAGSAGMKINEHAEQQQKERSYDQSHDFPIRTLTEATEGGALSSIFTISVSKRQQPRRPSFSLSRKDLDNSNQDFHLLKA